MPTASATTHSGSNCMKLRRGLELPAKHAVAIEPVSRE